MCQCENDKGVRKKYVKRSKKIISKYSGRECKSTYLDWTSGVMRRNAPVVWERIVTGGIGCDGQRFGVGHARLDQVDRHIKCEMINS